MYDDEPELLGYEPGDGRPLRSARMLAAMRFIVVLGLVALVLPGIVTTIMVDTRGAQAACKIWVRYEVPSAIGSSVQFEIFGSNGFGWQCYTRGSFGGDQFVASLGIIPGPPDLPSERPVTS